ncbi:hypothetical protein EIP91_005474 [Steccherinum ochraceum]|uniref:F-box domain-containing protein n=1 Tax=Steccherinum ochraceum TaxID=92696 RepID=A0A4R0S2E3_9APHY|nr:hypothetical protein EIP91_005474 [Steccherinum ochraceum]
MTGPVYLDEGTSCKVGAAQGSYPVRNAQSSIAMLPPELLVEIFNIFILSAIHQSPQSYSWIRITHVCHTWRAVALAAPVLWSRIYFSDEVRFEWHKVDGGSKMIVSSLNTCISEMLARSGNALLDVRLRWTGRRSTSWSSEVFATFRTLLSSVSRARTFTFICHGRYRKEDDAGLEDLISPEAPRLSSLTLIGNGLPALFANCNMPALREVELSPPTQPSTIPHILQHPLTRLHLYQANSVDLDTLLSTLKAVPSLEELLIYGVYLSQNNHGLQDRVSLARLKWLGLVFEDGQSWLALYDGLRIPPTTKFALDIHILGPRETQMLNCDQFAPTYRSMLRDLATHTGAHIRGVVYRWDCVDPYGAEAMDVELYTTGDCSTSKEDPGPYSKPDSTPLYLRPQYHFKLQYESTSHCRPIFHQLLHTLPLSKATWLSISDHDQEDGSYIDTLQEELKRWITAKMPCLTTLRLTGRRTTGMVAELLSSTEGSAGQVQWLMPHLTSLHLSEACFRLREACLVTDPSPFKENLMKVLDDRANGGAFVQRVVLSECAGLWEQDVKDMRETMGRTDWELEWDGVAGLQVIARRRR